MEYPWCKFRKKLKVSPLLYQVPRPYNLVSSQKNLQIKATTQMGRQICLILSGGICKAVHLCKCLIDQHLIHGQDNMAD